MLGYAVKVTNSGIDLRNPTQLLIGRMTDLSDNLRDFAHLLVGNAAQTMHPVAAQGLNLGLRDAVGLVDSLAGARDIGEAAVLAGFARQRQLDRRAVTGFTHSLIQLFDRHDPLLNAARGLGLTLLDNIAPLRRAFAGHLVFGVGG